MRNFFEFTVPGPPVPKARPRFCRGQAITPIKTRNYERLVETSAVLAIGGLDWPMDAKYCVECRLYYQDARRRDGTNVFKSIEDGLNGVAYTDDSQINEAHWYSDIDRENPRAEVRVTINWEKP